MTIVDIPVRSGSASFVYVQITTPKLFSMRGPPITLLRFCGLPGWFFRRAVWRLLDCSASFDRAGSARQTLSSTIFHGGALPTRFGTDELGRDVSPGLIASIPISLTMRCWHAGFSDFRVMLGFFCRLCARRN